MATIYDVAQRAGVSPATVSRTFRNSKRVNEQTRERILAAALELDYQANRATTARQTLMVGLMVSDIQNPFSAILARGVQDVVFREGYVPIICSTDGDPAKETHALYEMNQRGCDGFIVTPSQSGWSADVNSSIRKLLDEEVPIIFIGNPLNDPDVSFVTCRAQDGATKAVEHLASLGHRAIGFIGGYYTKGVAVGRWLGYQEGMVAGRLPLQHSHMVEADLSLDGGAAAMQRLLELPDRPTAVLVANDLMAIGAMSLCQQRGLKVPEDISIVGFDDIPWASLTNPPLTTVAQPAYEIGQTAAELLLQQCREPDPRPQHRLLHSALIIRATTAAPHTE